LPSTGAGAGAPAPSAGSGTAGVAGSTSGAGAAGTASGAGAGAAGTVGVGGTGNAGTGSAAGAPGGGGAGAGEAAASGGGAGVGGDPAAGTGGAAGSPIDPDAGPPDIPTPTGTCPEFREGTVTFMVNGAARRVVISMSSAAETMSGPLIFYWHATGGAPSEAQRGLPVREVTAEGGIVVAPIDVANAGAFPWLSQFAEHDALFDEVLGCAVQNTMIDIRRIHALGWSAGGIMSTHLSCARSKYISSVATYSGGGGCMFQEMDNKFAAMILAGGPGDQLVLNFYTGSMDWQARLKEAGHFAMFCDHGGGHSIPTRLVPAVWQFFKDHPYGTNPSPYAGGMMPSTISSVCEE
jgi:hypothetical protein